MTARTTRKAKPGNGRIATQKFTLRKVGAHLGAEITGLDLTRPLNKATVKAIEAALAEHQLLIFPGQDITSAQHIAFGEYFATLTVHPFSPNSAERPELILFDNNKDNPPAMTDCWHSDETFRAAPPLGTILRAKIVPEVGGDTMFASMTAAYEGLSDKMQNLISGLDAVHDFLPFRQLFGDDKKSLAHLRRYEDMFPKVSHPVVRVHPVSKQKVLFVNPQFTTHILGMDARESRATLDILFHQAEIPEYQFRHRWQPHVMVFWDNRSTQHYAIHDYYPQRRAMERVTLEGTRPVGARPMAPGMAAKRRKKPAETARIKHGGHRPRRQFERETAVG